MDPDDPACPIRKQVVPRTVELDDPAGVADPLDEVAHSPVKNVIRVYPDRIAFCVNNECALYCRFCLRKRMVGDEEWIMKKRELEVGLDWIRRTPSGASDKSLTSCLRVVANSVIFSGRGSGSEQALVLALLPAQPVRRRHVRGTGGLGLEPRLHRVAQGEIAAQA